MDTDNASLQQFAEENIQRIRTDPVWFFETVFHVELDIWQREGLECMADIVRHYYGMPTKYNHEPKTKISIRAMHGPGKTFLAAMAIIWFHTSFKGLSPATAPTLKQLKDRLWPNLRKLQNMADEFWRKSFEVRSADAIWHKDPDWKCVAVTGATPENMQGYHDEFMLVVCDEASGIDEDIFPVIEGALSVGTIVILLLIGNPTKIQGTFADSHLKAKVAKYYYQIHVDLNKTTRVSKKWVTEMEEKYGKDSPVVAVRCYGDFASEDENQLIALDWLETARQTLHSPDGSIPRQRISADIADGGQNFTVLTHAIRYESFTYYTKQTEHSFPGGKSVGMAADKIEAMWDKHNMSAVNGDDVVVDSLGVGAGVVSELIKRNIPVIRYQGGAASDDVKQWRCRRVQSYMVLRDQFRKGLAVFADNFVKEDEWDDLDAQLCSIKRKPGTDKMEDLLTKKEMTDQGIKSPDRSDSMAMMCATQAPMFIEGSLASMIGFGKRLETAGYDASISQ